LHPSLRRRSRYQLPRLLELLKVGPAGERLCLHKQSCMTSVGLVIPTYREQDNIAKLATTIVALLPDAKIAIVDDSPDQLTVAAVQALGLANVSVHQRASKDGRGSAVLMGIGLLLDLGCEYIVEMDADFSHPPEQISQLLAQVHAEKIDLLIASRYLPSSQIINWPLNRRIFSKLANLFARFLLQVPIHDYTNGFRVYTRRAAETVRDTCGKFGRGFISLSEILVNLHCRGFVIREQSTIFVNRLRGESSVTLQEIYWALTGIARIYLLRRRLERATYAH
jgi:dolichol-phosphate mannosyltransferase